MTAAPPSFFQHIGTATENILTGQQVEADLSTGLVRRVAFTRARVRPVRLVRSGGNMYLPTSRPLGTRFFYDVFDWGDRESLSMHLFSNQKSRDHYRYKFAKREPVFSGTVAFKKPLRNR